MANLDLTYQPQDRTRAFERHNRGRLVCLAGPGTGKTYSLIKCATALRSGGVTSSSLCYLTFIKEIANAFLEDYHEAFPDEQDVTSQPRISTLHSFACRVVRNFGHTIGYPDEIYFLNIADKDDSAANIVLADLLQFVGTSEINTPAKLRAQLKSIKEAWRDLVDAHTLSEPAPTILPNMIRYLEAFRIIDWDQTIPLAQDLLVGRNHVPEWISSIHHFFIDEYQDFNKAEQALIRLITSHATSSVIVGDDDQSIFSGRGGEPVGIRSEFANAANDQVTLTGCHRCRENIVIAANRFQVSMASQPRPMNAVHPGGSISAYSLKSAKAEIEFIVDQLNAWVANMPSTPKPKDGAVCLFPTWDSLDFYYSKISPRVACHKRRSAILPERIWITRVLQLLHTPDQRFIQRLLLSAAPGIKPVVSKLVVARVYQRNADVAPVLTTLLTDVSIRGASVQPSRDFIAFLTAVTARDIATLAPIMAARLHVEVSSLVTHLERFLENIASADIEEQITIAADSILPATAVTAPDPKSVLFLTMHGSKGLTRKNVLLPGLERACLPGDATGDKLSELERLFYVAITRAIDSVVITFPRTRSKGYLFRYPMSGRGDKSPFITTAGIPLTRIT
jgi:superfamily I DNA/RNA helicase